MRTLFDSAKSVNQNVPKNCFVIAEYSTTSGEITHTYFADINGKMFYVIDWVDCKPSPTFFTEIYKETGLSEHTISAEYDTWLINKARKA